MLANRICALSLSAAFAIICSATPAIASQLDGNWSLVAVTTSGHCGTIPIDVGISRGRIFSTGGSSFGTRFAAYPIQLLGRVSASGQVRMNAVAGPRSAQGTGRFTRFRGTGTWAGTGHLVSVRAFGTPSAPGRNGTANPRVPPFSPHIG